MDITGEMDMLVYSKSENAFLIIEIKRNDRLAYNSFSKWNWRKENASKLISQIEKDVFYLFQTNEGNFFLKDTFGEEASSASFFPLFLTDNFIMDHEKLKTEVQSIGEFIINTVSSFELCMLLGNKYSGLKVASELSNSIDFNRERPLESLIKIIDNNEFWELVFTKLKTKPIIHLTRRTEPKFCFVE
jgi:predicted nucleotidyltransferase